MSTLLVTNNIEKAENYILNQIKKKEKISNLLSPDIVFLGKENIKIKTQDIREIINKTNIKATNLNKKYLIILNFDKVNINGQNAFLKTLEESNADIYLQAENTATLLETTLSRVKIIKLNNKEINKELANDIETIVSSKKLIKIKDLTSKYDLGLVLNAIEEYIYKNKPNNYNSCLKKLYLLKKRNFETNLNQELQLYNVLNEIL